MSREPNSLRELAEIYSLIAGAKDGSDMISLFRTDPSDKESEGRLLLRAVALFNAAKGEIAGSTINQEIKEDYLSQIEGMSVKFCAAVLLGRADSVRNTLNARHESQMLTLLADLVQSSGGKAVHELDRSSLISSTQALIGELRESGLPEYAKDAMVIKLNALTSIVNCSATYPEDQIRQRVKAIVADFLTEFDKFDSKHKSIKEKVIDWGSSNLASGAFVLGLLADGSQIAGLITGPSQ